MYNILVSVLTYNSCNDALEAIECYRRQKHCNVDIQLIDNASTDDSVESIKRIYSSLPIIQLPRNIGYAGGNNVALSKGMDAGHDLVVVSNADVTVDENFISTLAQTASEFPETGIISGVEVDYYSRKVLTCGAARYNRCFGRMRWNKTCGHDEGGRSVIETCFVQGSIIGFTKVALKANIRFDEKLFMYNEETDLGFQLKEKGLSAYIDLRCKIYHKRHAETLDPFRGYLIQRNRIYITRKHSPKFIRVFNILYVGLFELPIKVMLRIVQRHAKYAMACVQGYLDGLSGKMDFMQNPFVATMLKCKGKKE